MGVIVWSSDFSPLGRVVVIWSSSTICHFHQIVCKVCTSFHQLSTIGSTIFFGDYSSCHSASLKEVSTIGIRPLPYHFIPPNHSQVSRSHHIYLNIQPYHSVVHHTIVPYHYHYHCCMSSQHAIP